jgi:heptosyltransferase-1
MRVLIVKTSALGDIIHALPVLDFLHQAKPGIEVDWVVEEPFRELLAGNPLVSQLHTVRTKAWRRAPFAPETRRAIAALKESLRQRCYDLVFDIQGNLKSGLIDWLSGGAKVLGFTGADLQERINLLFTTRQIPLRSQDCHVTDKYLRVISTPLGRDFRQYELRTDIHTSPADELAAEALLATLGEGLLFLCHTGTTWQTKFWHQAGWIGLAKELLASYPESTVLFSWGNETERQAVTTLATAIGPGARVTDRYSLKELAALLKKVDLVIGGDTGPVHLAAAVGTPTVSLFRSSDGKGSGPRGDGHVIIQSPIACTRCFRTKCARDEECRQSITVEMVMTGVRQLLAKRD